MTSHNVAGVETDEVLAWISSYRDREGYPPSRREVASHFDVGLETTQRILRHLVDEGLLVVKPSGARAINITGAGMKIISENMI
jgi:Mn-dependent DtxR family transcriptional regulator